MSLQTHQLVMIGLGSLNDVPPVDIQPSLLDGIHLRWAFLREAGFPWHGYYLFRRPHEIRGNSCIASQLAGQPIGALSTSSWTLPEGIFRSDRNLVLSEASDQSGTVGLDLTGRGYLQFDLPIANPVFRVDVTVDFRMVLQKEQCLAFPIDDIGRLGNRFVIDGVEFEIQIERNAVTLTATLPSPVNQVSVDLTAAASVLSVLEALDENDQVVASIELDPPASRPKTFRLQTTQSFHRFRLHAPQGQTLLHRLCYASQLRTGSGVTVTAFDDIMPVASEMLSYAVGQQVTTSLWFDRITSLRFTPGDGVLIDLCVYPVSAGVDKDWQPAPGCPQPLTLPITHLDYPARTGSANLIVDWDEARSRIIYGPPNPWEGDPFTSLYEQMDALVEGGPPNPPERAMAHPARAYRGLTGSETPITSGEKPPIIPEVHPLDLIILGAIHPAIAQMIGLYWADTTTHPAGVYDYLIIADHTNIAGGQVQKMLSYVQQADFADVDAWITFNKRMISAPPIDPPQAIQAYALPGGTYRGADTKVHEAQGNAGITWQIERSERGYLQPGHPVMYHVWRDPQGNGNLPIINTEARELVTDGRPLLLTQASGITDRPVQYPADWPPFSLRYIDFALREGWYGYQVNAIDLFGRFSPKSGFAAWHQWEPPPHPKPWYYRDPPANPVIHPSSLRILDKLAPPPPLAVEAYALDPADPLLVQDQAYQDWLATLPPADQKTLVGLRVRWWWTAAQQRQAPDTTEFRIYWHAGSQLPGWDPAEKPELSKWRDVALWQLRCFVCPYAQNMTILGKDETAALEQNGQIVQTVIHRQGDRRYEVFLPIANTAGPFTNGVLLAPTLVDPIAYANVTVTATDVAAHSPDRWLSAGLFAGRTGNESQPAAPQRVYQVWRHLPDPPPTLPEPARQYATPADYHSRSYFTYQWQPMANLWVHVYRALDDSVFQLDWAIRSQRGTIDLNRPEHQAYFPADWNAARRQVAATVLNALNSQASYHSLPDDALRVLAGLPGNEKAFNQLTTAPLDSSISNLRDILDGRAINRYFYRAAYVDKAQNRSVFSLASAPVFLPDVTPPKAPVITKVVGGDREITLSWASNREPDLAEYRVYRAASIEATRDIRLMSLVDTLVVNDPPIARPAAVQWTDKPVTGLKDFWYCVIAVDQIDPMDARGDGGNVSQPSTLVKARAICLNPPLPPSWVSGAWQPISGRLGIRLVWSSNESHIQSILHRRRAGTTVWMVLSDHLQADSTGQNFEYVDFNSDPHNNYEYQLFMIDCGGNRSVESDVMSVFASQP